MPETSAPCNEQAQVDRILADPLFLHTKRLTSLLRFVAQRAQSPNATPLSERALGVELFGRPPAYDTEADPIVRVTASELRKRLAQYYTDPKHSDELRVTLLKGSYAVEFLQPQAPAPPVEVESLGVVPPGPAQQLLPPVTKGIRWRYFAAVVPLAFAAILVFLELRSAPSISERFWEPITEGPRDVIVSFSQLADHVSVNAPDDIKLFWTDSLTPQPDPMEVGWPVYAQRLVHMSDLGTVARVSEFLGSKNKHVILKGDRELAMADLREAPAIILGGLTNQWTNRLLPQARFRFDGEGTIRFISDRQNPASRTWSFDAKQRPSARTKDFIIISRVTDSASGRVTMLAGGFSGWGTEAAVALLTDPKQMQRILADGPVTWDAKNIQVVLECSVVKRESGLPRVLATHHW